MTKNVRDIIQYGFAAVIMLLLFAVVGILIFNSIPEQNKDVLNIGIGVILGWGTMVVAYFFGSSKGSAEKNELLNNKKPDNTNG